MVDKLVGSAASVLSLAVSLYVAVRVREIRRAYVFRVRIPQHMRSLQRHARRFDTLLNDFEQSASEIPVLLGKVIADLDNVSQKLPTVQRKMVRDAAKGFKNIRRNPDRDQCWNAYTDIHEIIEMLRQLDQDAKWS